MKYHVTIKPKPYTIVVETMSGGDVAEEMARQQFAARVRGLHQEATLPIHDADHSKAVVVHVETFQILAQLEAKHGWSGAMGVYAGPIHNHGGQQFIQAYIGQHEWLAINVDDPTDIRRDPGYVAKIFGYGIVILSKDEWLYANDKELVEPEAEHPSILQDEILFNPKEVVEGYLGKKISDLDVH